MDLAALQRTWNDLARKDAMWAVLTGPLGAGRQWDAAAFFSTGAGEVQGMLERVRALGLDPGTGRALDFGCGVGRLSQPLARQFTRVDGVDIAPAMIDTARALTPPGLNCVYHLNASADLRLFADATFDFVYSSITLQHMEPPYSRGYIEEFFRVVRPGGLVVFQLPSAAVAVDRPRGRQDAPLPPDACRAAIDAPRQLRCAPGEVVDLRVQVRNAGSQPWRASDRPDDAQLAVRLGNHWRGRFGRMRVFDDRRTGLPFDVAPGESVEVGFRFTAPPRGRWTLELDMVQEGIRWFASTGSSPAQVRVVVDASIPRGAAEGLPPVMEMHGIAREDVDALIARCGGILHAADADTSPGVDMTSFRYFARRAVQSGA